MKSRIDVLKYVKYMNENECVKEWLEKRPTKTQECYASHLKRFCEYVDVKPSEFQNMDKKAARDIAWKYLSTLNDKETASVAITAMAAIKSFYRNHDGEVLPFDSTKHGKHYLKPHAKKASFEHTPTKEEVYQIIDKTMSVRDRAMMSVLYESGIRENALLNLTYGMVKEQLQKDVYPLHLKITDEVDSKLCGYDLPFYDTFIGREAIDALKKYCELVHKDSKDDAVLFLSRSKAKMSAVGLWTSFKKAVKRAGFDETTMWIHSLRKAYKSEVRKSNMQEELGECLMGHRLKGSRESYMNRNDAIEELRKAYMTIDFTRLGKNEKQDAEIEQLKKELSEERQSKELMEKRFTKMIEEANQQTLREIDKRLEDRRIQIAERQLETLPAQKNMCTCGAGPEGQAFKTWMLGSRTKVSRYKCTAGHEFNMYEKLA
jgi:site-specific recombinase XerD